MKKLLENNQHQEKIMFTIQGYGNPGQHETKIVYRTHAKEKVVSESREEGLKE